METTNNSEEEKDFQKILKRKYEEADQVVSEEFWSKLDHKLKEQNIYAEGKIIKLHANNWLRWAAAAVIPLAFGAGYFIMNSKKHDTISEKYLPSTTIKIQAEKLPSTPLKKEILTKETEPAEKKIENIKDLGIVYHTAELMKEIYLDDSSRVSLNAQSELVCLSYRKVKIKGQAFFQISHDKKHPFQVLTDQAKITVLGTSFFVNSKSKESTQVTVYTGLVAFTSRKVNAKEVMLHPGISGTLQSDGNIDVSADLDSNRLSWKENKLSFNNTPMVQVSEILERHFNTKVLLDNRGLENCTFTGTFNKPELVKILRIISATLKLEYKLKEGAYHLFGQGCE